MVFEDKGIVAFSLHKPTAKENAIEVKLNGYTNLTQYVIISTC